ncbi:MAG TPA: ribosome-associated translation inhibitor RaiA [Bacillota bacterium]
MSLRLSVRGRNLEVTEALRSHVEKKVGKIARYFLDEPDAVVLLSVEKERQRAELTLDVRGMILRAEAETPDMYASVDDAVDRLERRIRKHKTRINRRMRRTGVEPPPAPAGSGDAGEEEIEVVRVKRFAVKPMDPEEAVLQMNLLGHDFFVFRNAETGEVNVAYRRKGGGYGLIEPLA